MTGATDQPEIEIRPATATDAAVLAEMAEAFSVEDGQGPGLFTEAVILRDGFGADPAFSALIAWRGETAAGYALTFPMYNTEIARRGLWLFDLWVRPDYRSRAIGRRLLAAVARAAKEAGGACVWWGVRNDNERARAFYAGLGAKDDDARILELDGAALDAIAKDAQ